jgi:hypothetical protein
VRKALRWRLALACAVCVASHAAAQTCDRMPVRAATAQSIGSDMLVNGMPTAVWALTFDMSAERVEHAFRAYWDRAGLPTVGMTGARGRTMSGLDGACQYVLELPAGQHGDAARGVMSVMRIDPAGVRYAIPDAVAALARGRVLSDVESRDPGRAGRTWVIALPGRADVHAARYRDALVRAGWRTMVSTTVPHVDGGRPPNVGLAMQKGNYKLDAVFAGQTGQATAIINVMESG